MRRRRPGFHLASGSELSLRMVESDETFELPSARDLLAVVPGRWLRKVPGRETFPWPDRGEPVLAVKRYEGDHPRDQWYERLRGRRPRSPAEREFANLRALARDGFPVPAAVDWTAEGGRSVVAMAWVPHRETLSEWLARKASAERRPRLGELARLVARLHGLGYYHRDLYAHHFVVPEGPEGSGGSALTLLDLGRVRRERRPRRRWLIKDLGALAHSLAAVVGPEERGAFLERYFELAGPATLPGRRRWVRRIERRRRRIAAHVPRYPGDPA